MGNLRTLSSLLLAAWPVLIMGCGTETGSDDGQQQDNEQQVIPSQEDGQSGQNPPPTDPGVSDTGDHDATATDPAASPADDDAALNPDQPVAGTDSTDTDSTDSDSTETGSDPSSDDSGPTTTDTDPPATDGDPSSEDTDTSTEDTDPPLEDADPPPDDTDPATDGEAPVVVINSPTSDPNHAAVGATLDLGGAGSDNVGVVQVIWSNDRGGSGTCSGSTTWTASGIVLQSGENVITVTAKDAANNGGSDTLTVTYSPVPGDGDQDGVPDASDNCPATANPDQNDSDGDGKGNGCDNCPDVANADQADADGDGVGDACEPPASPPFKIRKQIITYDPLTADQEQYVGAHFDMISTVFGGFPAGSIERMKAINPNLLAIGYRYIMGMHEWPADPMYEDWPEVSTHEDWFAHNEFGHRLADNLWGAYVMDVGNSGWRDHYGAYVRGKLDTYPMYDGVFADGTLSALPDWLHAKIENESSAVNADGLTVTIQYPLWEGSDRCPQEVRVYTTPTPDDNDTNYYGGSFTAGSTTVNLDPALTPGTSVYVSYRSNDAALIAIPGKRASWSSDMGGMLQVVKAAMGDKLLVINSNDPLLYLDTVDGVVTEGFTPVLLYTFGSDWLSPTAWMKEVDALREVEARGKLYLAQSYTIGDETDPDAIREAMLYGFGSFLLGAGQNSLFHFRSMESGVSASYSEVPYYPEWDIDLGNPKGDYYEWVPEGQSTNVLTNASFEQGMTLWNSYTRDGVISRTVETALAKDGAQCVRLHAESGENCGGLYQYVSLKTNTTYTLSGWIRTESLQTARNPAAQILVYLPPNSGSHGPLIVGVPGGTRDWTHVSTVFTTGTDVTGAYVYGAHLAGGNGTAWFDDIRLEESFPLYARDFDKGKVIVNPDYGSCPLALPKTYRTLDGQLVDSIQVGPHQGIILLNP